MNSARIIFHLARADFYERLRRYSFLIMLGLSVFLGYQVAIGNLTLTLSQYRGEFNSAWVGAMVSLVATFFLGWFGFYLVKGSVGRDRDTGVGQIMATTPITRPVYMLGKWLSNFCVLMAMIGVLAVMGIAIQLWQGESFQIDVWAYLSPFLLIVLPCMALVAAFAVLFEAIPFLQGGFGNIAYFILFVASFPVIFENLETTAVFEPFGIGIMEMDMGKAVAAVYPDYIGGFSLGPAEFIKDTFVWEGVQWTPALILARTSLVVVSVLMVLTAALFFDRFDPARSTLRLAKRRVQVQKDGVVEASPVAVAKSMPMVHLSPLSQAARRYHFRFSPD